jgi:hypothetical protein
VGDRVLLLRPPHRDDARVLVVGNDQVLAHGTLGKPAAALPPASHYPSSYMMFRAAQGLCKPLRGFSRRAS